MRKATSLPLCIGAIAAWVSIAGPASADDNCTGHYVNFGSKHISISNDPTEPAHVLIGECHDGRCIQRDKEGDEMTMQSTGAAGDYMGRWKVTGGTGKYANARRSGWYRPTRDDGVLSVGDWGGTCY
jgi:hypothetical protein